MHKLLVLSQFIQEALFMKVKFKKLHPEATTPSYAKEGDAGLDITSIGYEYNHNMVAFIHSTGLAVEIPPGFVGLIFPRSSICKKDMILSNHVGVIDSSFRGEIKFIFKTLTDKLEAPIYTKGERIGQLIIMPYPKIELEEVSELSETERGSGGFGSTNK